MSITNPLLKNEAVDSLKNFNLFNGLA